MVARAQRPPMSEPAPVLIPLQPEFGTYRLEELGSCQCPSTAARSAHA